MVFDISTIKRSTQLPPRIVVYGTPGIGKTTFAASMPDPIFIPVEDGLGQLDVPAFPRPESFTQVGDAVESLINDKHQYRTLVLDSLDLLEPMIWSHVCKTVPNDKGMAVERIEQYGWAKGYTHALTEWRSLLEGLDILRESKEMTICLIGHSSIVRFETPESDPYERYQLRLHKHAEAAVSAWSDCVLFANYEVTTVDAGGNSTKKRGIGKGDRVLHTCERPAFKAKNRYSMPDQIPLSWEAAASHFTLKPKAKAKPRAKAVTAQ